MSPGKVLFNLAFSVLFFSHLIYLLLCERLDSIFNGLRLPGTLNHALKSRFFEILVLEQVPRFVCRVRIRALVRRQELSLTLSLFHVLYVFDYSGSSISFGLGLLFVDFGDSLPEDTLLLHLYSTHHCHAKQKYKHSAANH